MIKSIQILALLLLLISSCSTQEKNIKDNKKSIQKEVVVKISETQPEKRTCMTSANYQGVPLLNWNQPVPNGLKFKSSVRSIFRDSKGNMWFGTDKEGVCRSDGMSLTYFTMEDGLCNPQIRTIQEDKNGNIWFSTGKGVAQFDGKKIICHAETIIHKPIGYKQPTTEAIKKKWMNNSDALWFDAGHNDGVIRYDGTNLDYLEFPSPEGGFKEKFNNSSAVYSIHVDKTGKAWFGTLNNGVIAYDGQSFEYINEKDLNAVVRSISKDRDGNMWFGNNGVGVFHYDGEKLTNFTKEHGLENPNFLHGDFRDMPETLARIWAIQQDSAGNMWFGTIDAGIWRFNGEKLTQFTTKDGLVSNSIESIYYGKDGSLWVGTANGGIHLFNGYEFFLFTPDGC